MASVDLSGRPTRWLIAPVLVGLAVAVALIGAHGARDATVLGYEAIVAHSQDPAETARAARYRDVEAQVRADVPAGATVFVPQTPDLRDVVAVEWEQRLNEIALMEGHPVTDPGRAEYWLRVVQQGGRATLLAEQRGVTR